MEITFEFPGDRVRPLKLRAASERKELKKVVSDFLQKGLIAKKSSSKRSRTVVKLDKATLKRGEEMTRRFVSGEWAVKIDGYKERRSEDRKTGMEPSMRPSKGMDNA